MMGAGQQQQVVAAQAFAARITGMGLHGQLRLSQPAAQGFAINSQQTATFGQSDEGHQTTPFVLQVTRTTTNRDTFPAVFPADLLGVFRGKLLGMFPGRSGPGAGPIPGRCPDATPGTPWPRLGPRLGPPAPERLLASPDFCTPGRRRDPAALRWVG